MLYKYDKLFFSKYLNLIFVMNNTFLIYKFIFYENLNILKRVKKDTIIINSFSKLINKFKVKKDILK